MTPPQRSLLGGLIALALLGVAIVGWAEELF